MTLFLQILASLMITISVDNVVRTKHQNPLKPNVNILTSDKVHDEFVRRFSLSIYFFCKRGNRRKISFLNLDFQLCLPKIKPVRLKACFTHILIVGERTDVAAMFLKPPVMFVFLSVCQHTLDLFQPPIFVYRMIFF